ncbi:MAG: ABC transporter ATP-binding protein, partial [Clostridia bacterium]|nr:ABC transporter ATP-binding protein [Clostridia bacterium]
FQEGGNIKDTIIMIVSILVVTQIYRLIVGIVYRLITPIQSANLTKYVNDMMYEKLNKIELSCYENKEFYDKYVQVAGDMLGRINTIRQTVTNLLWIFTGFSSNMLLLITIEPWLIVFAFIPLLTTFIFGRWDGKYTFEYNMERAKLERQRDYSRRTFYLSDFAKEMRLSRMGEVMLTRFRFATDTIIKFMKRKLPFHAFLQFLMGFFRNDLCVYGAMFFAVYRTLVSGSMMYGDCLVVINSVASLIYYMSDFSKTNVDFYSNSLYIDNLKEFMAYEPTLVGGELDAPEGGRTLELKDIHFRYDGQEKNTIRGVDISIAPGEKIALVGHNGAGKTTLAKLMLRLYDPTCGTVTYDGKDIKEYKLDGGSGYRDRFAVVFQDFKLFSMSVADNILLRERREGDDELVRLAMEQSGVYEKIASLENGAATILTREFDDNGVVLSGGEGQKVAIARAFAKNAQIVILDEPSSALDPVAEYKMYENMLKACENRSVVFISHRLSSATLADTIYLLENGKVVEKGSHSELMKLGGKYAEMFRIQAENYVDAEVKNEEK